MGQVFAFLTLVATLVFAMGVITHPKDTVAVTNSLANGITHLFTLELGQVPKAA